jgi:hypothetical protein
MREMHHAILAARSAAVTPAESDELCNRLQRQRNEGSKITAEEFLQQRLYRPGSYSEQPTPTQSYHVDFMETLAVNEEPSASCNQTAGGSPLPQLHDQMYHTKDDNGGPAAKKAERLQSNPGMVSQAQRPTSAFMNRAFSGAENNSHAETPGAASHMEPDTVMDSREGAYLDPNASYPPSFLRLKAQPPEPHVTKARLAPSGVLCASDAVAARLNALRKANDRADEANTHTVYYGDM